MSVSFRCGSGLLAIGFLVFAAEGCVGFDDEDEFITVPGEPWDKDKLGSGSVDAAGGDSDVPANGNGEADSDNEAEEENTSNTPRETNESDETDSLPLLL